MTVTSSAQLQAWLGGDLAVVNAARASFAKESSRLTAADRRLLQFLAHPEEGQPPHESPFRHAIARWEVTTTLAARLRWEGVANTAGMVFRPTLAEVVGDRFIYPYERHTWRWTANLAAAVRWLQSAPGRDTRELAPVAAQILADLRQWTPQSVEALTGLQQSIDATGFPAQPASDPIPCLDKGYVRRVGWMDGPTLDETVLSFEIKAPLMVARQWFKYTRWGDHCPQDFVLAPWAEDGSGNGDDGSDDPLYARNEASRRYVTMEPEFYEPAVWRSAPENKKQGSGKPLSEAKQSSLNRSLNSMNAWAIEYYLAAGVAPEQARLFLPAYGLYTVWRWTASGPAVQHYLDQRLHHAAQDEMRKYAQAVAQAAAQALPEWFGE